MDRPKLTLEDLRRIDTARRTVMTPTKRRDVVLTLALELDLALRAVGTPTPRSSETHG